MYYMVVIVIGMFLYVIFDILILRGVKLLYFLLFNIVLFIYFKIGGLVDVFLVIVLSVGVIYILF